MLPEQGARIMSDEGREEPGDSPARGPREHTVVGDSGAIRSGMADHDQAQEVRDKSTTVPDPSAEAKPNHFVTAKTENVQGEFELTENKANSPSPAFEEIRKRYGLTREVPSDSRAIL